MIRNIMPILLLYNLSSLGVMDHLWQITKIYIMLLPLSLMKTLWFLSIINVNHKAVVVILMVILMRAHCFHNYILCFLFNIHSNTSGFWFFNFCINIYIYIYYIYYIYIIYILYILYIYIIYMMDNNIHDGYRYTKTCKEQWTVNKNIKISE